jgi:hypothetical protein
MGLLIYVVHPRVGICPQNSLPLYYSPKSYIHSLLCTNPQSQAPNQTRYLCTKQQILLPKLGQMHIAKTLYHSTCTFYKIIVGHKASSHIHLFSQSNYVHIDYIHFASYFYNTFFFIYILQPLTIRPNHGKTPWDDIP